jgi:hypothetical protein
MLGACPAIKNAGENQIYNAESGYPLQVLAGFDREKIFLFPLWAFHYYPSRKKFVRAKSRTLLKKIFSGNQNV